MLFALIYTAVMTFVCTKVTEMVPSETKRR